jgi:hypothetical protein
MPAAANDRQFRVHARHLDRHHARTVSERSFEAAAVAYVEDLHALGDEPEISVIVLEVVSGHEQCFTIDLGTGEAEPCG